MTVNNKRVFYVKYLAHQIYADILKARADVRLDRLENETPEAGFAPVLSAAHAYPIRPPRDELAPHFPVHDTFLRPTPNVLAYDPYLSKSEIAERGAQKVELDELLQRSDYVSINCPLTKESRGLIGARQFALMQPHAYFITTARGFIHDEDALLEALRAR